MSEDRFTVPVSWLRAHLNDPDLVILDCRFNLMQPQLGQQHYATGHIPNAHYLDLNQDLSGPVGKHGGRHPLPDVTALSVKLGQIGVSSHPQSLVVVYDDSKFAYASRLWWLLTYLGHDRVVVLDGGWNAWQQNGYEITTDPPTAKPQVFTPQIRTQQVVDIDTVKTKKDLPNVVLIDAREGDRYRGEREPIDPIAGHIPGAVNYPWQDVSDSQGFLLPNQSQLWQNLAQNSEIMVYCGSGVTACVNLLSLKMAGIENAKLYAGSWSDWCSYVVNSDREVSS